GLAKVFTDKGVPEEALKVLDRGKGEFKNNAEAAVQAAAIESMAYQKMGQTDKAEAAIAEAEKLAESLSGKVSAEIAMDMAKSLFQLGEKEKACDLLQTVVKNNHENAEIISQIEGVFQSEQLGEEGENLIQESKQEVVNINNQGVILAREGKLEEAVELLRKAVQSLPNSEVMLMNLCGMLIGLIKKTGKDDRLASEAKNLLDRVRELNPTNKKYHEYASALNEVS
ncbi:MAG: tetratricopeptide repeat protein, partial [Deltaproteobacteria bacterium]|nr:tetratricopeptide repeat protein [Deltaproteobacteria bacterium]